MVLDRLFQSTRPLRGATDGHCRPDCVVEISIHAPLAGRDGPRHKIYTGFGISIHAPLAGRDRVRLPGRGVGAISIHAPLAGRDCCGMYVVALNQHFNPRAPCGARPIRSRRTRPRWRFQSTRPLRGATLSMLTELTPGRISIHAPLAGRDAGPQGPKGDTGISIHAPLAGRDGPVQRWFTSECAFQSTRPLRGATPRRPSH